MNIILTIFLCFLGCACCFPASSFRQIKTPSRKLTANGNHATAVSGSVRKYLSSHHVNHNQYHSKTHKRHLRKKKQYILAGLGAGLGAGLTGYGYNYGSLAANSNPLGYTTPNDAAAYGYAAGQAATNALGGSLIPSAATGGTQQRQNLLSSFGDTEGLSSYSNAGLGSYSNNNVGLSSYGKGASSYSSLNSGGIDPNSLSNTMGGDYESKLNALANSFSSNGLSNSQLNGISALSSYGAGNDANSYSNLKGLNSLVSSSYNTDGKDLSNLGGKYTAASLSAGLDTPNGISNIANLLNSAATSFDTDAQTQVIGNNNQADLNRFGQRFGNHMSGAQSAAGGQSPYASQATLAEAQAFGNQLDHLSAGKINLGSHSHASYGNFGDNIDSNSLNEIGQIASTGISDSSLQKLLGQLMTGQTGHGEHGVTSQGLGGLPTDASVFEQGNSEPSEVSLEDQQAFANHQLSPLLHGQTVHAHASDKPKAVQNDEEPNPVSSVAIQKAMDVQWKADREHQKKLKNLKEKLRMLREKLRRLKSEYDGDSSEDEDLDSQLSSELSEKSEMETLDDLKKATEDAIKELQKETLKVAKAKGLTGSKKLIFIHKYPQSNSDSDVSGKKKGNDIGELGTDLLELIEDENEHQPGRHDGTGSSKQDDTQSLTNLEKQAEQEVNFLTNKSPKVIRKQPHSKGHTPAQNTLNPGLHIHIPEPVDEGDNYSQIRKPKLTTSNASGKIYSRLKQRPRIKVLLNKKQRDGQREKDIYPQGLDGIEQLLPVQLQSHVNQNPQRHDTIKGTSYNSTSKTNRKHSLGFFSIGCWRDQPERALPSLEGIFPILDGNYMHRKYAIRKCAQVARVQGFFGFAIENGGHCFGGKNVLQTYSMFGPSRACRQNGKGGPWSMEVYKFTTSSMNPKNRRGDIIRAVGLDNAREIFFKG